MRKDYINKETGLLYCGKCNTPKQIRPHGDAELFGGRTFGVLCKCQQEAEAREKREQQQREFRKRVQRLRREAFRDIPGESWRFDSAQMTDQLENLKRYANHWEEMQKNGMGLLLNGGVGTGKSYAAGCLANALLDQGHSVRFVGLSDVVNRMQGSFNDDRENYLEGLLEADLLILDDLGSERNTSYGKEQVFAIINKRTLSGKPLVVTTNIAPKEMKKTVDIDIQDRRIYDRLLEKCLPISFTGESFRKANTTDNCRQVAAILNGSV